MLDIYHKNQIIFNHKAIFLKSRDEGYEREQQQLC